MAADSGWIFTANRDSWGRDGLQIVNYDNLGMWNL